MLSDRCLSCLSCPFCAVCLSVMFLYCGQTVGWTKMKLGMEVGLSSGHIVLDGDPAPPLPKKGARRPIFGQTVADLIYCGALASNAGFAFCGCNMTFCGPPEHTSRVASGASLDRGLIGHCTCGHPLNPPLPPDSHQRPQPGPFRPREDDTTHWDWLLPRTARHGEPFATESGVFEFGIGT